MTKLIIPAFSLSLLALAVLAVLTACGNESMERVATHALTSADTANGQAQQQSALLAQQNAQLTQQVIAQNNALLAAQQIQDERIYALVQTMQWLVGGLLLVAIIVVLAFAVARMRAPVPQPTVILLEHRDPERYITPKGEEVTVTPSRLPVVYRRGEK